MWKKFILCLFVTITSTVLPLATPVYAASVDTELLKVVAQIYNSQRAQALVKDDSFLGAENEKILQGILAKKVDASSLEKIKYLMEVELSKELSSVEFPYGKELALLTALLNENKSITQQSLIGAEGTPSNYHRVLDMKATAYAPGTQDNGIWNQKTYVGSTVRKGVAAVDPKIIPMGTKLWVEGYGEALAVDQGSAIKGNRIDLAFDNREEALDYGIKTVKVYILN